ncbi:hypothetical protein ES319_D07G258700v1 [Gossypium barbadense]|uniref:Uncharacterized protein n=1 Tax=Gossypium barbadense TaxID=3634 RepID=A0A5J5QZ16_GOSBA|nr:hypothetical protein ES319_D07G258700v1 [Gossypium barbadense]
MIADFQFNVSTTFYCRKLFTFFNPEVLARGFLTHSEPFLGLSSPNIFCFWDKSKINLLESVYLVLNISDYCSNDRFIRIRALTFLDDSFRVSHNFYFVDSQLNP